jgi:hypothetical protein
MGVTITFESIRGLPDSQLAKVREWARKVQRVGGLRQVELTAEDGSRGRVIELDLDEHGKVYADPTDRRRPATVDLGEVELDPPFPVEGLRASC